MSERSALRVALIEDDPILGESLVQRLTLEGMEVVWCRSGAEAVTRLRRSRWDFVVCDIRLPDMNGEEVYGAVMPELGGAPIIFMTAFGDIEQAVRLMRAGADDYLIKPFKIEELVERLDRQRRLAPEGREGEPVLGLSPAMRQVETVLRRVASLDTTVLLLGESGAGKEVAARFLHGAGNRATKPFVGVNCAALAPELADSEIFGHERGAFTSAVGRHTGVAERAADGILFLDEVAELPAGLQAKLLRLIEERSFTRVGGEKAIPFRAKLVCATNADLRARIAEGSFREDLYYRINVIEVTVPPLRDRRMEIVPLARHFLQRFGARFERGAMRLSPDAETVLMAHDWPGNVRELRNRCERAVALAETQTVDARALFPERTLSGRGPGGEAAVSMEAAIEDLGAVRERAEREHIRNVLVQTEGQVGRAAGILGISRTTLWEKMRRFGIGGDG
ncbi:DNA-binding NtrC family response regulator [Constrictibacter sp. MBR-5]|uniref:sigma-54-dependent transcriptional regulator n=1 Tax=Constrictibacter sp. MBR-5 TaxID=3156467 RepID=UPI00339A3D41